MGSQRTDRGPASLAMSPLAVRRTPGWPLRPRRAVAVMASWAIGLLVVTPGAAIADPREPPPESAAWVFSRGPDRARIELDAFTADPGATGAGWLQAAVGLRGYGGEFELALGLRLDGEAQTGSLDFSRARVDYAENTLRWRRGETRVTVGTQVLAWGRTDEIPPVDRLSRADISRGPLDPLPERRRAVPALRVEHYVGDLKLDAAWLPVFDPAVLPDRQSVWNPVDTIHGRILGIGAVPFIIGAQVESATVEANNSGGLRLTRTGAGVDWGLSVQRVRQSLPYYRGGFRRLTEVHPLAWVLGGELEAEGAGATWRIEAAWTSDTPVTTAPFFRYRTVPAWDAVAGAEMFARDGDTRLTLQLAGHRTQADVAVYDRTEFYLVLGEIEHRFGRNRWRANLRFSSGIGERDLYVNPRLAYTGFDGHEFFLAGHWFAGGPKTLGGYYAANDLIALGWQARF